MINQMQGQSALRVKQHFDFMVSFKDMKVFSCCFDINCTSIRFNEANSNHICYLRNVQQSEPKTTSFIKSRILHSPSESLGLVIMENGGFMDSKKYYLQPNKDLIVSYIKSHYSVFQQSFYFATYHIFPKYNQRYL